MKPTFEEYVREVARVLGVNRGVRVGQAYANILHVMRPDLSHKVLDSLIDPFYDDKRLGAFIGAVQGAW